MAQITFVDKSGRSRTIEIQSGRTLMEGAIAHSIAGIDADCRGSCACGTCHVLVAAEWLDKVGGRKPLEDELLGYLDATAPNSRLSCQIIVQEDLSGLVVTVAT